MQDKLDDSKNSFLCRASTSQSVRPSFLTQMLEKCLFKTKGAIALLFFSSACKECTVYIIIVGNIGEVYNLANAKLNSKPLCVCKRVLFDITYDHDRQIEMNF